MPAATFCSIPARSMSRCDTASASPGTSRRVLTKYLLQRIRPRFSDLAAGCRELAHLEVEAHLLEDPLLEPRAARRHRLGALESALGLLRHSGREVRHPEPVERERGRGAVGRSLEQVDGRVVLLSLIHISEPT